MLSHNIKKMVEDGGMQNAITNNSSTKNFDKDYGSQIDVQTVADPDAVIKTPEEKLKDVHDQAVQEIAKLYPFTNLTDAQKINLAMWLTILSNSVVGQASMGDNGVLASPFINTNGNTIYKDGKVYTYGKLRDDNYIKINNTATGNITTVSLDMNSDTLEYHWGTQMSRANTNVADRLTIINTIKNIFEHKD